MKNLKPGMLFILKKRISALTTDPWSLSRRTITYADHVSLHKDEIVMLVEINDMEGSGIYVWLWGERIIWQILSDENFNEHWKRINLS